jgi:hypothetical protein
MGSRLLGGEERWPAERLIEHVMAVSELFASSELSSATRSSDG